MENNIQNTAGIYIIRNSINDNVYIGQSAKLLDRIKLHFRQLSKGKHLNPKLQRFVNKYGLDCLSFDVLEYCEKDKAVLCDREQYHMNQHKIKFNIAQSAYSTLGVKKSAKERLQMSLRQKGKKQTPEQIEAAAKGRTGVKHSFRTKEHCEKIRQAALKRNMATFKGKKHKPETKELFRQIALNRPPATDEFKKKMSLVTSGANNGMFGRKQSEAAKEKIRQKRIEYLKRKSLLNQ